MKRREVLGGFSGVTLLSAVPPALMAQSTTGSAFPADDLLDFYKRMRFGVADEPVWWWLTGTKFGLADDVLLPLYDMQVLTLTQYTGRSEGAINGVSLEMVMNLDRSSGELLRSFINPYTGEERPMDYTPVGPAQIAHTLEGPVSLEPLGGATITRNGGEMSLATHGDTVWLSEGVAVSVARESGELFHVADWAAYRSSAEDLRQRAGSAISIRRGRTHPSSSMVFTSSARPPTSISSISSVSRWSRGRKARSSDALPSPGR